MFMKKFSRLFFKSFNWIQKSSNKTNIGKCYKFRRELRKNSLREGQFDRMEIIFSPSSFLAVVLLWMGGLPNSHFLGYPSSDPLPFIPYECGQWTKPGVDLTIYICSRCSVFVCTWGGQTMVREVLIFSPFSDPHCSQRLLPVSPLIVCKISPFFT